MKKHNDSFSISDFVLKLKVEKKNKLSYFCTLLLFDTEMIGCIREICIP